MKSVILVLIILLSVRSAIAQGPNHLAGSTSPYLLQHLDNPVDWYPWGPEALEKAESENKLILVSVGYASCHWCHVMEEESFMNEEIAGLLNRDFISIKIDRESRPDLDEQFMTATQLMTGGGGWPNTVFLTPQGDPFFAQGYMPPQDFSDTLAFVQKTWLSDPDNLILASTSVTQAVSNYLTIKADAREITPDIISALAADIYENLDEFNGGYGVAPKFPRETMFLFLLDHANRTGGREALNAVTGMLDGMIKGGIHDHVGGGFHRYAVDPEWHVPHFEKMLYTQALVGKLLVRIWALSGEIEYKRTAERLFDYVLREFKDNRGGFYSAQDAVSQSEAGDKIEGAFYTWTPDQIASLGDDAALISDLYQVTETGDLEGTNVLNLSASVPEIAAEQGLDPAELQARVDTVLNTMHEMRSSRPAPLTDRKIVVSWNAVMIQSLAEAGYLLKRPDYLEAAEAAAKFIKTELLGPDGLKRISFDGKRDVQGQLEDYAGMGLAFLALHDFTPNPADRALWLTEARKMADAIGNRFGSPEEGFAMTQAKDGMTRIIPLNDTDIPSGNALALSLFSRLADRSAAPELEQQAYKLAAAVSGHALSYPNQRGYLITALQDLQWGETGPLRYVAGGKVRVELRNDGSSDNIIASISVADGWHINAHEPLEDYLVATSLVVEGVDTLVVRYPQPVIKTLAFNDMELALLEGDFDIVANLPQVRDGIPRVATLTLQACNNEICLSPEDLVFRLW